MDPPGENELCAVCHVHPLPSSCGDDRAPLLGDSREPSDQIWSRPEHELASAVHEERQEAQTRPEMDIEEVKR